MTLCDLTACYACYSIESAWFQRLKVKCDKRFSSFAFNCFLRRYTVAVGGMATALPSKDASVNAAAAAAVRADKEWEAKTGFLRGWAAHTFHVTAAAAPFVVGRGRVDPILTPGLPRLASALEARI